MFGSCSGLNKPNDLSKLSICSHQSLGTCLSLYRDLRSLGTHGPPSSASIPSTSRFRNAVTNSPPPGSCLVPKTHFELMGLTSVGMWSRVEFECSDRSSCQTASNYFWPSLECLTAFQ